MKLLNVWEVTYSVPTNFEDAEDTVYFDDKKEALAEFKKQLKEFISGAKGTEEDVRLLLKHNKKFIEGYRVCDGQTERM